MTVYQFSWRGLVTDLVIDVDAASKVEAVARLQQLIETWRGSDDPSTLDVTNDQAYARVWFNLDPRLISEADIVDWWEEE